MTAFCLHVRFLDPLVHVHVRVVRPRVVLDRVLNELESGQADGVERQVIGATRVTDRHGLHAQVVERFHPGLENRRDRLVPLEVHAANRAGSVVHVEIAGKLRVRRLEGHSCAIGKRLGDVRPRSQQPCSSPPQSPIRTVRRIFSPDCLRMRTASIITADPAALSVAPVPECHESKCAPSMTSSSALSVPGISPTTLKDMGSS